MDIYHVLNRGTDKRDIVSDDADRYRFMRDLYIFNDKKRAPGNAHRRLEDDVSVFNEPRVPLVHIHAFCLMDNHYHLLLSEAVDDGIPYFMHKLNMGYSKYFNEKYKRTGTLWQGTYKKINIIKDSHFIYIPYYIHINPLDYEMKEWRQGKITDKNKALKILENYKWSSHLDYSGVKNYPSIIEKSTIEGMLGKPHKYRKEILSIISDPPIARDSKTIE
jgi:putative transposase